DLVPWWTVEWIKGLVDVGNGNLGQASKRFSQILNPDNQPKSRGFDFTGDYVVRNKLAETLFRRSQASRLPKDERQDLLRQCVDHYLQTLKIDPDNIDAQQGLKQAYRGLVEGSGMAGATGEPIGIDADKLKSLARTFADGEIDATDRLQSAKDLKGRLRS